MLIKDKVLVKASRLLTCIWGWRNGVCAMPLCLTMPPGFFPKPVQLEALYE